MCPVLNFWCNGRHTVNSCVRVGTLITRYRYMVMEIFFQTITLFKDTVILYILILH
ncbi:hypothetical protein I79_013812 [Cricetulus griseus]|uniref:Uncharacterized protein n=1 Tax=Cricetulus griseus TaxID=10029 RepID=G3HSH9_CRIGR|nr:hypothetical protein I79_013812 [Cricetulus griseus]